MTVVTTSVLSNSIRTRYKDRYIQGAEEERLYDQFATPVTGSGDAVDGVSPVQIPFLSELPIVTTAISQTTDITPSVLRDAVALITGTSRAGAVQTSQELEIRAYTDYVAGMNERAGRQAMMSQEWLAIQTILNGDLVYRAAARASLDAGTTSHNFNRASLMAIQSRLQTLRCPRMPADSNTGSSWMALGHSDVMADLVLDSDFLAISQYQDKSIALNQEIGAYGAFRLVADARAKVFGSAGAAHASVVATTLSAAANALATSITVASSTNIGNAGRFLTIGTAETAATFDETLERVMVTSTTSTTIRIVGGGANGGLRWDHASGVAVSNADSVYPVVFGYAGSLAKMYATATGPMGEVLDPERTGLVKQFVHVGWKWFGGYGIWVQPWLYRGEFSSRLDNVST